MMVPKTAVIGAGSFIGRRFLSFIRLAHPGAVGTARSPASADTAPLDLLSPDIRPLKLARTGHAMALITAAVTSIVRCEHEPQLTRRVNVEGTLELARQLQAEGVTPVFTSSDMVFDGKAGDYTDASRTAPVNEYGRQKAAVEAALADLGGPYLVVRLSKVFSTGKEDGTFLNDIAAGLAAGRVFRAAADQVFCPTDVEQLVDALAAVLQAGLRGIVNVCGREALSWHQIAVRLADGLGVDPELVRRISIDELGDGIRRPHTINMLTERLDRETTFRFKPLEPSIRRVAGNWARG